MQDDSLKAKTGSGSSPGTNEGEEMTPVTMTVNDSTYIYTVIN